MSWIQIISLVFSGLLALGSIVLNILQKVKAIKNGETVKVEKEDLIAQLDIIRGCLESSEIFVELIKNVIPSLMIDAENSGMVGAAKKMYVKSGVVVYCKDKEVNITDQQISDIIENYIKFSKIVNGVNNVSSSSIQNSSL